MKKVLILSLILVFSIPLLSFAQVAPVNTYSIGDAVENFTLMSVDGKPYTFYSHLDKEGSKGVLLMWVSWKCPISNNCNDRMIKIADFCKKNNITFLGINPNSVYYDGTNEDILAAANEAGFNFPVLRDWNAIYTDKFKSVATPTAILIDTDKILRYRGRIDDSHGWLGRQSKPITEHTLMNVLDEFLAGKELSVTDIRSAGCTIKRLSQYYKPPKGGK